MESCPHFVLSRSFCHLSFWHAVLLDVDCCCCCCCCSWTMVSGQNVAKVSPSKHQQRTSPLFASASALGKSPYFKGRLALRVIAVSANKYLYFEFDLESVTRQM